MECEVETMKLGVGQILAYNIYVYDTVGVKSGD
jgi:hypothetical protein